MYVFVILYVYMYIYTHNCLTPCIYNFLYQVLFPILTFNGIHWFILVHTFIITYLGLQMSLWIIFVNSSTHSAHFGLSQWQFTQFLFQFLLSLCLFVSICIYIYICQSLLNYYLCLVGLGFCHKIPYSCLSRECLFLFTFALSQFGDYLISYKLGLVTHWYFELF